MSGFDLALPSGPHFQNASATSTPVTSVKARSSSRQSPRKDTDPTKQHVLPAFWKERMQPPLPSPLHTGIWKDLGPQRRRQQSTRCQKALRRGRRVCRRQSRGTCVGGGNFAHTRRDLRLTDASPPTRLWSTDVSGCDAKFRRGLRLACLAEFSKLSKLYQKSSLSGEKGETLLG